jgi:hypothetical protein
MRLGSLVAPVWTVRTRRHCLAAATAVALMGLGSPKAATKEPSRGGGADQAARGKKAEPSRLQLRLLDAEGRALDSRSRRLAFSRELPSQLQGDVTSVSDPQSFRVEVHAADGELPSLARLTSRGLQGNWLDSLDIVLSPVPCGDDPSRRCGRSNLLRIVGEAVDRYHPAALGSAVIGEVGGVLEFLVEGPDEAQASGGRVRGEALRIGVGSPSSPSGSPPGLEMVSAWRGRLTLTIVRQDAGAPRGGDLALVAALRREVARANAAWGQCGIHFGVPEQQPVSIVVPPADHLVAVGCELGLPALGGKVGVKIGPHDVVVSTSPGDEPAQVARRLGAAIADSGWLARVWPNPPVGQGALPTADITVTDRRGRLASLRPWRGEGADPRLSLCIGHVELGDGLHHFVNSDAESGTLEERTLLRSLDDRDPTTIDVIVVPSFDEEQRIGESFMAGEHGSLRGLVVLDRTGLKAGDLSLTLAHELGHILLNEPGHPDAWGADTPTQLMDSDALDPTIFGPRRLSLAECQRAWRESGTGGRSPFLVPWTAH